MERLTPLLLVVLSKIPGFQHVLAIA